MNILKRFIRKRAIALLVVGLAMFSVPISANAKLIIINIPSNKNNGGSLKALRVPGDYHIVTNGVEFECYTTGVYEINVTDEDGNIIYYQKLYARAGRTYFIYIPGLNPDEDVIE